MDRIYFNQTGGLKLTTNLLNTMQNAFNIFNSFSQLAGNLTILAGCNKVGGRIEDGVVIVDSEIINFKGGIEQKNVRLIEIAESKGFEDGSTKDVVFRRYIEFGDAIGKSYKWSDFKRIENVINLKAITVSLQNNINSINQNIVNHNQRLGALENKPDNQRQAATAQEVIDGTRNDVFVSPKHLPNSMILLTGKISATGSRIESSKVFYSRRVGVGIYEITHNLNTTSYAVVGAGIDKYNIKVSMGSQAANKCVVGVSDDSSLNDESFSILIFKTS